MKRLCMLSAAIALTIPALALSQTDPYYDADNPFQAIGMMQAARFNAETMLTECTSRFPDQAKELKADLDVWKSAEVANIRKANYQWNLAFSSHPTEDANKKRQWRVGTLAQFEVIEKMDQNEARYIESEHCQKYFADLASGVWHQRTPKMYAFMDQVPDVPKEGLSGKQDRH